MKKPKRLLRRALVSTVYLVFLDRGAARAHGRGATDAGAEPTLLKAGARRLWCRVGRG